MPVDVQIIMRRLIPQAEDTIDWVIDELNDNQSDQYENYTYNLSMVLASLDFHGSPFGP
jgi:hypothetical protein